MLRNQGSDESCHITLYIRHIAGRDFGSVIDKPLHTFLETWESAEHGRLENKGCIEGNKADKAAHRQLDRVSGSELNDIVIHSVSLVPQA